MNGLYTFLAAFLSGVLGAMGLGGGGVLIIYLSFVLGMEQMRAQGINLTFFIPIAVLSVIIYLKRGQIKLKPLLPYIISALPGAILGTALGGFLGNELLGKLFGAALIALGIKELFSKGKSK